MTPRQLDRLPIQPLRNTVLFPGGVVPMRVGNVRTIEYAEKNGGLIAVLALKTATVEVPRPEDLHLTGTLGTMRRERMEGDALLVQIRAVRRVRLVRMHQQVPFMLGSFEALDEPATPVDAGVVYRLRIEATALAREMSDHEYRREVRRLLKEVAHAGNLSDLLAANLFPTIDDKQRVLEIVDPVERVNHVLEQVLRMRAALPERRSLLHQISRWFRST